MSPLKSWGTGFLVTALPGSPKDWLRIHCRAWEFPPETAETCFFLDLLQVFMERLAFKGLLLPLLEDLVICSQEFAVPHFQKVLRISRQQHQSIEARAGSFGVWGSV